MTLSTYVIRKMGKTDNGGRFTLNQKFETITSRRVRKPSRAWPNSIYKHCQTKKYFDSLSEEQLQLIKELIV